MLPNPISRFPKILVEHAIAERLRRHPGIELHPTLFNTPLIYSPVAARMLMISLHLEYTGSAAAVSLPSLLTAPTLRLAKEGFSAAMLSEYFLSDNPWSHLLSVASGWRDPDWKIHNPPKGCRV